MRHSTGRQEATPHRNQLTVAESWSAPRESGGTWRYGGLTQKRFNALAGDRRVPRFLFLVVVPPEVSMYADAGEDFLRFSRAAYWVSLRGHEQVREPLCDRALNGVHLLISTAARTVEEGPRMLFEGRRSGPVESFLHRVALGTARPGSYVLTTRVPVAAPSPPQLSLWEYGTTASPGRSRAAPHCPGSARRSRSHGSQRDE
ncbi:MAG: hypothetical protein M3Y33_03305 [Actinomycetota bacterium]|nr:hypothetical protein [Actinomycetota bacterium]